MIIASQYQVSLLWCTCLFSIECLLCIKCENASRRYQPGESHRRGLLCEYENRWIVCSSNAGAGDGDKLEKSTCFQDIVPRPDLEDLLSAQSGDIYVAIARFLPAHTATAGQLQTPGCSH